MTTQERSDEQLLVAEFVAGDTQAVETLIERHRKRVYNYILMMVRDRALADDIFQETFIKVVTSLQAGRYTHDGKFVSWVLRIAHNQVIDYFRAKKGKRQVTSTDVGYEVLSNCITEDNNAEQAIISDQAADAIRTLVDRLPVEQREVIVLRHYMDLSFKEIAEQTGVSINTALGRMRYGLINLRKLIDSTPAAEYAFA
ncbi:MAG: sigma-70 family RNA polymerase sigma factor, partial [Mucinivorans sp.]